MWRTTGLGKGGDGVAESACVGDDTKTGGTITTITDLLGRIVSTTDVWGTVTTPVYDELTGRVTRVTTSPNGVSVPAVGGNQGPAATLVLTSPAALQVAGEGSSSSTTAFTYDLDGKVTTVAVDGVQYAGVSYDSLQQLASVAYLGGSQLASVSRDPAGRVTGQQWSFPSAATVTDRVVRSQAGRVVQEQTSQGSTTVTSTYGYDGAGRLVTAAIPGHQLTYGYAGTGGCGPDTAAGRSGNRTGLTDVWTNKATSVVTTTSTSYCYDWADRLLSSSVTSPVAGASTVADGLAASDITYDVRGNTTKLADMTFAYDAANQHVGTTFADGSTVTVMRDAAGRVISRTVDPAGSSPAVTTKYLYPGGSDAAWGQVVGTGLTRQVGLPGGVTVTLTGSGVSWVYPSLLGHTLVTGDGSSTTGGLQCYDPFGQPLDPATNAVGTTAADDTGTTLGNTGWHGAALKQAETVGSTMIVEMGARLYLPALGRFLQVDPIEGGVDNDYTWPTDPIGLSDPSGLMSADSAEHWIGKGYRITAADILPKAGVTSPELIFHHYRKPEPKIVLVPVRPTPINLLPDYDAANPSGILSFCAGVCVQGGYQGKWTLGVGLGVEAGLSFSAGGVIAESSSSPFSTEVSCTASRGGGAYAAAGLSIPDGKRFNGVGFAPGAKFGCATFASVSW